MSNTTTNATQQKVTVVGDTRLLSSIQDHRQALEKQTGLRVSMSAAAASLIRTGLAATKSCPATSP